LPPERYPGPVWNRSPSSWPAHELAEEERQAAAQAELDADGAADSAVAAAEAALAAEAEDDSVVEEPAALTPQPLAKPPRTNPSPKPKPPRKKPGPKPKAKAKKEKRVYLTEDEHLTLFRLCNFHAEAYRKTDNVKF
jgi:hypothetical protein